MSTIDVSYLFLLAKRAIEQAQIMSRASRFDESLAYQRTALSHYKRASLISGGKQKEESKRLYGELLEGYITVLTFRVLRPEERQLLVDFFRLRRESESIMEVLVKVQKSFDNLVHNLGVVDESNIPQDLPRIVVENLERWREGAMNFNEVDHEIICLRKKLTDWGNRYFAGL